PFGLAQSQAEHGAQGQRRRDRQGRIVGLTAPRSPWFGAPGRDRLVAEPDRQTATLPQPSIIFRPVRYPIPLPGDVMTAIGIGLERHGGHPKRTMDGVASSHLGLLSQICRPRRFTGCGNPDQPPRSPAQRWMALYTYSAPDVSPADPCNKMPMVANHLLQSARLAKKAGFDERVVMACLLHDIAM